MTSYIPIRLNFNSHSYTARLYGDRIVCGDTNLVVNKSEITNYKISFFKRKIELVYNGQIYSTDYNKIILSWFDPLYTVRIFTLGIFIASPLLMGLLLIRSPFALSFIPVSVASGFLGYYFFKATSPSAVNSSLKVLAMLLVISLPVIFWYPVSAYIFATGAGVYLFLFIIYLAYSNALNIRKYYLSLSWIMILVFFYFWLIAAYQTVIIFQTYQKTLGSIELSQKNDSLVFSGTVWSKPLDWAISNNRFFTTLLKRRNLLWTFSPYPAQMVISSEPLGDHGWISYMPVPYETVLSDINKHLSNQKKILLAEIQASDVKSPYEIGGINGVFETFSYYDMVDRKLYKILLFIRPDKDSRAKESQPGSLIFALRIPASFSVNYYAGLIKEGFVKSR